MEFNAFECLSVESFLQIVDKGSALVASARILFSFALIDAWSCIHWKTFAFSLNLCLISCSKVEWLESRQVQTACRTFSKVWQLSWVSIFWWSAWRGCHVLPVIGRLDSHEQHHLTVLYICIWWTPDLATQWQAKPFPAPVHSHLLCG